MESRISNFSREELKNYIETHSDIKEFYNFLGLRLAGGNYRTINKYIKLYGLENEYAAFKKRVLAEGHKKTNNKLSFSDDYIFCENSNVCRSSVKRAYIKHVENKCQICGTGEEWYGGKITLQIHHINGIYNDNRLENLQLLCPNCHSQTDNFRAKNIKESKKIEKENNKEINRLRCERWNIIQNSNIDFTKSGWVKELSELFGIAENKAGKYVKKNFPEFYKTCYTRKEYKK